MLMSASIQRTKKKNCEACIGTGEERSSSCVKAEKELFLYLRWQVQKNLTTSPVETSCALHVALLLLCSSFPKSFLCCSQTGLCKWMSTMISCPRRARKKTLVQAYSSGKVHNADLYSYEERINVYSWMTIVACTKMVQNGKNLRSLVSSRSVLYLCGSCKTEGGKGPEPKRQTQEAFPISRSVLLIGQSILHKKTMLVQGWLISSGFTFSRFPVLPELKLWCIAVLAARRRRVA